MGEIMSHYTKEDIARMVEEEDVEFIRLQFVDVFGILKNMAVTATQLDSILNHKCTFEGAAINGFDTSHVDELVLVPDLDSFTISRGVRREDVSRVSYVMSNIPTERRLWRIPVIF